MVLHSIKVIFTSHSASSATELNPATIKSEQPKFLLKYAMVSDLQLASYPGLPSQLFSQPWKEVCTGTITKGLKKKHHMAFALLSSVSAQRNEVTVFVLICNDFR